MGEQIPQLLSPVLTLQPHQIRLYVLNVARVEEDLGALPCLLTPAEWERARRFKIEQPRRTFVAGRSLLRVLLARATGAQPLQLELSYSRNGKPSLIGDWPVTPRFNVSHSGDLVIVGLNLIHEIGVDVERVHRRADVMAIARRFFTAGEHEGLQRLAPEQRAAAFVRCWVAKEAYLKARGSGISEGLRAVEVTVDPSRPPCLLRLDGSQEAARRWSMYSCQPLPGYVACVAVEDAGATVEVQAVSGQALWLAIPGAGD